LYDCSAFMSSELTVGRVDPRVGSRYIYQLRRVGSEFSDLDFIRAGLFTELLAAFAYCLVTYDAVMETDV
jgi:hypothetical protein